jgi:hypothetical protein
MTMGLVGALMFIHWATTFNKPGGLSLPPTISVETPNSPLATPSTLVCLVLFGASFDCEWHSPKAFSGFDQTDDDQSIFSTAVWVTTTIVRSVWPFQSLRRCAILNSIRCT